MQKVLTGSKYGQNPEWVELPVIVNVQNSMDRLDKVLKMQGFSQEGYSHLRKVHDDWYACKYRKQLSEANLSVDVRVDAEGSDSGKYIRIAVHKDLATDHHHHLALRAEQEMTQQILRDYVRN